MPITLSVDAVGMAGGTVRLSVQHSGRARIKVWDSMTKQNEVPLPAEWPPDAVPARLYVEGVLEGLRKRDTTLMLVCYDANNEPKDSDTVAVTVTPILTQLLIEAHPDAVPDAAEVEAGKYWITSRANLKPGETAASLNAEAICKGLKGRLRLAQEVRTLNRLAGGGGAHRVPPVPIPDERWSWDFPAAHAGGFLIDCEQVETIPFYTVGETPFPGDEVCAVSADDNPRLPIDDGPGDYVDVAPPVLGQTSIDVTYLFILYAVWEFDNGAAYYLGYNVWSTRFQGVVKRKALAPGYDFAAGPENAVRGSDSPFVVDNTPPASAKPPIASASANWR